MRNLISLLLIASFVTFVQAQENKALNVIKNPKLNEYPINQRLFLHLNKTKFTNNDTIWFKGYSMQGPLQQESDISQTMIVALLNSKNEVVRTAQFLILDGTAEGQIPLDKYVGLGFFEVVAYGSNMLNQDLSYVFRTSIEITPERLDKFNFSFGLNKPFYKSNDQVEVQVLTYDRTFSPHINEELYYDIWDGTKKVDKGRLRTNTQGVASLQFPYSISNNPEALRVNVQAGGFAAPFTGDAYALSESKAIDIQLLPEGGDLIADLMQIVAFRCVNNQGIPIDISGDVLDSDGNRVSSFYSAHQGMGKLMLVPKAGQQYTLHIKSPEKFSQKIAFPAIKEKGVSLSFLGKRNNTAIFKVAKNFEGIQELTAVWQVDGFVFGAQNIVLENEKMFAFNANLGLPTSIAKLTIFDKQGIPLAERLVFLPATNKVSTKIEGLRGSYRTRSKGTFNLEFAGADSLPLEANVSVLITHIADGINEQVAIADIRDYTVFKSELSGNVYEPQQYFDQDIASKLNEQRVDLVMLTHGWRTFSWYNELSEKLDSTYEYFNYDLYRGVVTKGKTVVPDAKISVHSFGRGIESEVSKTDEEGKFWVKPEFEVKASPSIIISTERKNELSRAKLTIEDRELEIRDSIVKLFHSDLMPYVYHYKVDVYHDSENTDSLFQVWDTKYLSEITVLAPKKPDIVEKSLERFGAGSVRVIKPEEDLGTSVADMESMILELGFGLYVDPSVNNGEIVRMAGGSTQVIPIILDGIEQQDIGFPSIEYLNSDMVEGIAFVRSVALAAEVRSGGQYGAIFVWTKGVINQPRELKDKKNIYKSKRYGKVLQVYNPKYDTPAEKKDPVPDERVTILWDNNVKTDSSGKASVTFYTGDKKGKYLINIQGISKKNGPVFKEEYLNVY